MWYNEANTKEGDIHMAKICPECGREFENRSVKCPICKCGLEDIGKKYSTKQNGKAEQQTQNRHVQTQSTERTQNSGAKAGIALVPVKSKRRISKIGIVLCSVLAASFVLLVGIIVFGKISGTNGAGISTVDFTIPAEYVQENKTQAELDRVAKESGYKSITLNSDGSVTYKMSKKQHDELMAEMRNELNNSLKEMVESGDNPTFVDIKANSDFTQFTVTTTSEELNLVESFSVLGFYMYGYTYAAFDGREVDNISVKFVNASTGKVISQANSKDL